jgi:hypothetical protein
MSRRAAEAFLVALAIAGSVVVLLVAPRSVRIPVATLFLLVLPGYLASLALFAPPAIRRVERVVVSLALSIAVVMIVALVLDVTVGLRARTWVIGVAVVEGAACLAALRHGPSWSPRSPRLRAARMAPRDVILLVVAIALVSSAVALARTPLSARHVDGYTALSIVPVRNGGAVRVVVTSGELKPLRYTLVVRDGFRRLLTRRLAPVAPGTKVVQVVPLPRSGGSDISALLYRMDDMASPYRSVTLYRAR